MNKGNFTNAQEVIQSLIQGNDPITNEALPAGSVIHNAVVLRALMTALSAMQSVSAREARRAQLPDNVGKPWTKEEEELLVIGHRSGDSLADCATRHGRTLRAIESRLEKLGLITAEQRTTTSTGFITSKGSNTDE
jgi:hypothetical protein